MRTESGETVVMDDEHEVIVCCWSSENERKTKHEINPTEPIIWILKLKE